MDILIRGGERETDRGEHPCENGGRDWSATASSQGMPGIAGKLPGFRWSIAL